MLQPNLQRRLSERVRANLRKKELQASTRQCLKLRTLVAPTHLPPLTVVNRFAFERRESRLQWKSRIAMPRQFDVVIERDSEGYYVASVPQLPACHTQGRSLDEVMDTRSHRTVSGSRRCSGTGSGVRWHPACDHRGMSRAPRITGADLLTALAKAGFNVLRIKGSHFLRHEDGRSTVVPVHSGEIIGPGLLRSFGIANCPPSN